MEIQGIISSGLLELYAMGLASNEEAEQVKQWIKTYPEVLQELKDIQLGLENYAQAISIPPASTIKDKIFASINAVGHTTPVITLSQQHIGPAKKTTILWKLTAAAAVTLLIGSTVLNFLYYNKFKDADTNLKRIENELVYEKQYLDEMKQDMSVVQSKYSEPIGLHGMDAAPDATAKIFWMKNTGEIYIDPSNLPDTPQGKQYQLWAIVDEKPVNAGVILTSKKGDKYRIQKMKTFGKAEAFAVTLEKEGGSESPSMDKLYVMGKI